MLSAPPGIYIHVPFCIKKCDYCDFYSVCELSLREEYVKALCAHISRRAPEFSARGADSLFFGGGTPSLLSVNSFEAIFRALEGYNMSPSSEITLEANPKTLDFEKAAALRKLGVNRISVGVQSFCDSELAVVGRIHSAHEAHLTIEELFRAGMENISLDLIFGLPGQTRQSLLRTLDEALSLPVSHISFYGLCLEENTPLYGREGARISDELYEELYLTGCERLEKAGFGQYEISNFSLKGKERRHNIKYWDGTEYIAFGAAAHGFTGSARYAYLKDVRRYCESMGEEKKILDFYEELSSDDILEEYVMLSARTVKGICFSRIAELAGRRITGAEDFARRLAASGLAKMREDGFFLTPKGMRVSNEIIVEFLLLCE